MAVFRNSEDLGPPDAVAILSGKGGTGKTSISVSLGYLLARCGFKTLLVDLDLFTRGMTFYALGEYPQRVETSLVDLFTENEARERSIRPVLIPSAFTDANLFLLPSVAEGRDSPADIHLSRDFSTLEGFRDRLERIIAGAVDWYGFDYVLIDTRGGTDHTSIAAAYAAGSFILVTEADKPSWDMGRTLLDAMDAAGKNRGGQVQNSGFIINKSVLPAKAVGAYLRREWVAPHLGTIPLDQAVIRCFQQDRVPVAEDVSCPFSRELAKILRKGFVTQNWTEGNLKRLKRVYAPGILRLLRRLAGDDDGF